MPFLGNQRWTDGEVRLRQHEAEVLEPRSATRRLEELYMAALSLGPRSSGIPPAQLQR